MGDRERMTGNSSTGNSALSDLKPLVHLLQLCHGVLDVCLQGHVALIRLPLGLPEQVHLLLQTLGVPLLRLTPERVHQKLWLFGIQPSNL